MDTPGPVVNVPVPAPAAPAYSRDKCLFNIVLAASWQLRQDADRLEQEDVALLSRLNDIRANLETIQKNDRLLR
jgi:hypothetical protein